MFFNTNRFPRFLLGSLRPFSGAKCFHVGTKGRRPPPLTKLLPRSWTDACRWRDVLTKKRPWWTKPDRWICFYNYIWNIYIYELNVYEFTSRIWTTSGFLKQSDIDNLRLQCAKSLIYMNEYHQLCPDNRCSQNLPLKRVDTLFPAVHQQNPEKNHPNYYGVSKPTKPKWCRIWSIRMKFQNCAQDFPWWENPIVPAD